MRLPFRSWECTFRKLGFQRVAHPGSARASRSRTFRPRIEPLEARQLLTVNTPPIAVDDSIEVVENQAYIAGPSGV